MFIPNFLMVAARIQGSFTAALENESTVTYQNYHDIPDSLKGCEVSEIRVVDGAIHLVLRRNTTEMPEGYSFECGI